MCHPTLVVGGIPPTVVSMVSNQSSPLRSDTLLFLSSTLSGMLNNECHRHCSMVARMFRRPLLRSSDLRVNNQLSSLVIAVLGAT